MKRDKLIGKVFGTAIMLGAIVGMIGSLPAFIDNVEASPGTEIWDWYDLDSVRNDVSATYVMMCNLNSTTAGYPQLASSIANGGVGWRPLGNADNPFTGTFDGNGMMISNLEFFCDDSIHCGPNIHSFGLFKHINDPDSLICDLNLNGWKISLDHDVGGLVGRLEQGAIRNCHISAAIVGQESNIGLESLGVGTFCCSTDNEIPLHGDVTGNLFNQGAQSQSLLLILYLLGDANAGERRHKDQVA